MWVNLFIGNTTEVTIDGKKVVMKQETDYPWDGLVMPVEKVSADPRVRQNTGKRALQRGPLVYCLEETDNAKDFADLALTPTSSFEVKDEPDNLGGIRSIKAISNGQTLHFIPYYAWDNRKAGKMKVWIDYQE